MLAGNPPFEALTALEVVHKHVAEPPRPPGELASGIPAEVSGLVLRLLAKEVADRPASARDLLDELSAARRSAETAESAAAAAADFLAGGAVPEEIGARAEPAGPKGEVAGARAVIREVLGPEGRAYTRVPAELVANVRAARLSAEAREKLALRVVNLSEGGLFLACDAPLAAGTVLELTFRPAPGAPEVQALAAVRWVSDAPRGMGLEFVRLAEGERARIRGVVERSEAELVMESLTRTELHQRLLKIYYAQMGARVSLAELAEHAGTSVVMVREGLKPFVRHKLARLSESQVEFRPPPNPALGEGLKAWVLEHGLG